MPPYVGTTNSRNAPFSDKPPAPHMSKRKQKRIAPATGPAPGQPGNSVSSTPRAMTRRKLWTFRLITLLLAPIIFGGLLEGVLTVAGYGYPTAFLLPRTEAHGEVFVPNNQFGWRFFGREMARWPCAF